MDSNNNGIPDNQETIFTAVKAIVLLWSMAMLSTSYFINLFKSFVIKPDGVCILFLFHLANKIIYFNPLTTGVWMNDSEWCSF